MACTYHYCYVLKGSDIDSVSGYGVSCATATLFQLGSGISGVLWCTGQVSVAVNYYISTFEGVSQQVV